jgi:cytochrome c oxidase accessory protein FixG
VNGTFRRIKWALTAILLAWWHLAPFLRWDRGPGMPDQAVLVDLAGRRAYFFFIEIWPQEVYYLTGMLLMAGVALFLMSSMAGRVWCGFLCWQTVYTDLFVAVERLVVGDRRKMMELDRQSWNARKIGQVAVINSLWLLISAACGVSYVLFFGDAFQMLHDIFTGQASEATYAFIGIIGGFCFLLGGHARERVCVYMCPYGRFQSAMFDEHSLIVTYEAWRGEPRGPIRKGESFEGRGHCLDCGACVISCPTGTDIRFGNQLSCIGCALCIDACNDMMVRHNLPGGLISYDSEYNIQAREKGQPTKLRVIRPRTMIYMAVFAAIGLGMLTSLALRSGTRADVLHERSPLFVELSSGDVRNGYTYKILNMQRAPHHYTLAVEGLAGATVDVVGARPDALDAPADAVATYRVYVTAPAASLGGAHADVTFVLTREDGQVTKRDSMFAGPSR